MTYEQAVTKLEELALEGSDQLIPATQALPHVDRQKIWRLVHSGQLPAVRLGEFKTTKEIAVHFFRIHIRVTRPAKETVVKENRKQQIDEAIKQVMNSTKRKSKV